MIFTSDPMIRARLWQCVARLAMGTIAAYNALLGLTEPTSLTARALGPDSLVDMVQLVQVICATWILAQAGNTQLRQSAFACVPFCFVLMSLLVQFWFVIVVGLSSLVAAYYLCLTGVFTLGAISAATNRSVMQRFGR